MKIRDYTKIRDYMPGRVMVQVMITRKPPHYPPKIPGELFCGISGNNYLHHYLPNIFGNLICNSFGAHSTWWKDMIYLAEGYDLSFFLERLLSAERSLFDKISLGMVEGYDLPPQNMVEGYDLPILKNLQKLSVLNYGGRIWSTSLGMVEGHDLPFF